jgi:hypothetical protein
LITPAFAVLFNFNNITIFVISDIFFKVSHYNITGIKFAQDQISLFVVAVVDNMCYMVLELLLSTNSPPH